MAWNFGKKPEDTPPADSNQPSEIDQLIEKISARIDEKLSPINAEITSVKGEFQALKDLAVQSAKPKEPVERRPATSVLDNEDQAFAERIGPVAFQNAQLGARMIEHDVIDEMKETGWSQLIPTVRDYFAKTDIQRKAQPDYEAYCRNCVTLAIGEHAKKNGFKSNGETFYLESSNTSDNQPGNRGFGRDLDWVDSKGRTHTADEVARKLGIEDKAAFAKEFLQ